MEHQAGQRVAADPHLSGSKAFPPFSLALALIVAAVLLGNLLWLGVGPIGGPEGYK